MFTSSTRDVPEARNVPRHVAIIMDGNGRWAKQRMLPRVAGHRRGVEAVRAIILACIERDIEFLTLFAFSSENWRRPADEVSILMDLFLHALEWEVAKLHANGIRFKVIGDTSMFVQFKKTDKFTKDQVFVLARPFVIDRDMIHVQAL